MMDQAQMEMYAPQFHTDRSQVETWTGDDERGTYHSNWLRNCARPECATMIDMVFHDHIVEHDQEGRALAVCFEHS